MSLLNIKAVSEQLPAGEIVGEVNRALHDHNTIVVTAPPGAGKSTLLPLTIMEDLHDNGKIVMLEPRRIAARQIAERMSSIAGEHIGNTVGYRVRFENKVSDRTRIEVLTEGILTRMIISDQTLDGVSVVIFDEFHERSINTDLALSLVRQTQQLLRPNLKIVIMSATIDTTEICESLHAPLIESKGKMFPVRTIYAGEENIAAVNDMDSCATAVAKAIVVAHNRHEGDILAFLPGQADILRCMDILGSTLYPTKILPLYGNLSPEQQYAAISPSGAGERKVVLSTPVAETSVTIEGVRIVIDSGLHRSLSFNAQTGLSHLQTVRISQDMATQRAGRAGRVSNGICYRLWTRQSEHLLQDKRTPEIADADLSSLLLSVMTFGENDIYNLPWLTIPSRSNVIKARQLLTELGAITQEGNISAIGKRMTQFPCHPRMARMILSASDSRMRSVACDIAALLEEKDPMSDCPDTDISIRISALRQHRRTKKLERWKHIARISTEYRRITHTDEDNFEVIPQDIGELIAHAYPERIAMAINDIGDFRLANGNNVKAEQSDSISAHKWIAIASLHSAYGKNGRIFLAAPLCIETIDSTLTKEVDRLSWDSHTGSVIAQCERRIGKIVVDSKPLHDADADKIKDIVCEAVRKNGLSMFSWNEKDITSLQQRVAVVSRWHPELELPDISTAHLMETAHDWLPFYLEQNGRTLRTANELKKLNLHDILWATIPYDMQRKIDDLAPTHYRMPTGSNIRIDYRPDSDVPVLSVRLQECFGMKQTPCIDNGKRPLLMELLSPGFKPVQLTQDLASFWHSTYFEVRKEMRRRYPKHYWPENPLEAEAVKGVKKK